MILQGFSHDLKIIWVWMSNPTRLVQRTLVGGGVWKVTMRSLRWTLSVRVLFQEPVKVQLILPAQHYTICQCAPVVTMQDQPQRSADDQQATAAASLLALGRQSGAPPSHQAQASTGGGYPDQPMGQAPNPVTFTQPQPQYQAAQYQPQQYQAPQWLPQQPQPLGQGQGAPPMPAGRISTATRYGNQFVGISCCPLRCVGGCHAPG